MGNTNRDRAMRITMSGMLLAVMLVLGYVESLLPSPGIPGIKLGLSNSVLIFAVYMLDIPTAYILMGLKVLLSGLMFGGVSTMMYAFAGGILSLTGMVLLRMVPRIHTVVVSMVGGLLHNAGQVVMAMIILHTPRQMLGYLGILMLVGLACGALTGVTATAVMRHMRSGAFQAARSWKSQTSHAGSIVPVVLAVVIIAFGLFLAWRDIQSTRSATLVISTSPEIPITDANQPPF